MEEPEILRLEQIELVSDVSSGLPYDTWIESLILVPFAANSADDQHRC